MPRRQLLTLALVALMLPGLVLARGASVSLCLCGGPMRALTHLVDAGECCPPSGGGGCCAVEAEPEEASCCDASDGDEAGDSDGPIVGRRACGGCAEFAVGAVDLTFEPHSSGEHRGDDAPSVVGAPARTSTAPLAGVAIGAALERGPPGASDRTTPTALRRGDRPMRN